MSASHSVDKTEVSTHGAARDAELLEAMTHRYAQPLTLYARSSTLARIEDVDALMKSFWVQQLARPLMLNEWRESGLALRRWLVHQLLIHARARLCELHIDSSEQEQCNDCGGCACANAATTSTTSATTCATKCSTSSTPLPLEPHAFEHFERAWSRAMMNAACSIAQAALESSDDAAAWNAFRLHFLEGNEYAALSQQLGLTVAAARINARRAHERVDGALRQLLRDEGVADEDVNDELAWLIEVSKR